MLKGSRAASVTSEVPAHANFPTQLLSLNRLTERCVVPPAPTFTPQSTVDAMLHSPQWRGSGSSTVSAIAYLVPPRPPACMLLGQCSTDRGATFAILIEQSSAPFLKCS